MLVKSVFIAGSRKFFDEINELVASLEKRGIVVYTASKHRSETDDESEKAALSRAFERMKASDVTYIFAKNGYVGNAVAMEASFAYAQKKEILASELISDQTVSGCVSRIVPPEKLAAFLFSPH